MARLPVQLPHLGALAQGDCTLRGGQPSCLMIIFALPRIRTFFSYW